jgi:hypothetical protein
MPKNPSCGGNTAGLPLVSYETPAPSALLPLFRQMCCKSSYICSLIMAFRTLENCWFSRALFVIMLKVYFQRGIFYGLSAI